MLNLSLPCPIPSCRCGGFSKIFYGYSEDLKYCLLTNKNKHNAVEKLNVNWIDLSYNLER